jgi:hypothetical protein
MHMSAEPSPLHDMTQGIMYSMTVTELSTWEPLPIYTSYWTTDQWTKGGCDGRTDKNRQTIAVTLRLRFAARVNYMKSWLDASSSWMAMAWARLIWND